MPLAFPIRLRAALAAALALLAAPAFAGELEERWRDLAFNRCAEPIMRNAELVTGNMWQLPAEDALRIDFRSGGQAWRQYYEPLLLINMQHRTALGAYRGCRVDFDMTDRTRVPADMGEIVEEFEDWIEDNVDNRAFRDVPCAFGDRLYARKIKTRTEVRPGVHLSIVIEIGHDRSFVFFAAVEEPLGTGECINES